MEKINLDKLNEIEEAKLISWHDWVHIFWNQLLSGTIVPGWTFERLFEIHKRIVEELNSRSLPHVNPINSLDTVRDEKINTGMLQEEHLYSVEGKSKGLSVSVHKKGKEVRIFSTKKNNLTNLFPTLIENIKTLSEEDFILEGKIIPFKLGESLEEKEVRLFVWDIPYYKKSLVNLKLSERIKTFKELEFNEKILEVDRMVVSTEEELTKAIMWAENLNNSSGAIVKELSSKYVFGENEDWKKITSKTN